jgi:hypothetical protein
MIKLSTPGLYKVLNTHIKQPRVIGYVDSIVWDGFQDDPTCYDVMASRNYNILIRNIIGKLDSKKGSTFNGSVPLNPLVKYSTTSSIMETNS